MKLTEVAKFFGPTIPICNQFFCKEIFNRKLWSDIKLTQLVKIDVLKKNKEFDSKQGREG